MNLERGVAKMPEIAECGNARIQWRRIQYNGEDEMPEKTTQWRSQNARKDNTMRKLRQACCHRWFSRIPIQSLKMQEKLKVKKT